MIDFEKPSPQILNNPYIVIPEDIQVNKLSLSTGKVFILLILFLYIFISFGSFYVLWILISPFIACILLLPILLLLFFRNYKVELIKDKTNNTLTVNEKNYFCCKKKYKFSLEYTSFFVFGDGIECESCCCPRHLSEIILLNVNPNVTDINNNSIKNTPFKFIYRFGNLIRDKSDLELDLEHLIGNKYNNNINEEIDLYAPKQEIKSIYLRRKFLDNPTEIFVKISEHFYMFYNYNYLYKTKSNENFRRLDWIYTTDFDNIFIGVVKNDTTYINTFIYSIGSIDKFILEIRDGKFCLKVLLKGGINTEICRYTKENEENLNTLIYLINGQINKINNNNNQGFTEKPDNSAPTTD